jgi:hypothetical protein
MCQIRGSVPNILSHIRKQPLKEITLMHKSGAFTDNLSKSIGVSINAMV